MVEPTQPLEQVLPFDDGARDEIWFQNVCAELLSGLPEYESVEQYGVSGNKQFGIDISAKENGDVVGFQCKHYTKRRFGAGEVKKAVLDATYAAEKFVLMLCSEDRNRAADEVALHPKWELWDKRKLSTLVRQLDRERGIDLVRTFFSVRWVESFFGETRARSFVDGSTFYEPFAPPQLIDHTRPLVNLNVAAAQVASFVAGTKKVLVAVGRMGAGKSRFFREHLMRLTSGHRIRYTENGVTITEQSLHEIPSGLTVIVVDSIENSVGIERMLPFVAERNDVKLVVGVRPSSLDALTTNLTRSGLDPFVQEHFEFGPLGRSDVRALLEEVAPTLSPDDIRFIVLRSAGDPLAAISILRILQSPASNRTEVIRQVRNAVRQNFGDAAYGVIDPRLDSHEVLEVMGVCAALNPVNANDEFIKKCSKTVSIAEARVRRILASLEKFVFMKSDGRLHFSPDIMRSAILHDTAFAGASSTGTLEDIVDSFGYRDVIRNAVVADEYFPDESAIADLVWPVIEDRARKGGNSERIDVLKALRNLGAAAPERAIAIARMILRTPQADEVVLGGLYKVAHSQVVEEIAAALAPALEFEAYALAVVAMLWEIGASDARSLSSTPDHPIRVVREAVAYQVGRPMGRSEAIIKAIHALSLRDDLNETLRSPAQMLEPALALSGLRSEETDDEKSVTFTRFALRPANLKEPRSLAIEIALKDVNGSDDRRADRALQVLQPILSFSGAVEKPGDEADNEVRNAEKDRVLTAFETLVRTGRYPLRELRIAELLRWSLRYVPDASTERVLALLALIPDDEERALLKALAPDTRQEMPRTKSSRKAWQQHQSYIEKTVRAAAEAVLGLGTPKEMLKRLEERLTLIRRAGLSVDLTSIMNVISAVNFSAALAMTQASLREGDDSLFFGMAGALRRAWVEDPDAAFQISQEALGLESQDARIAVVHGVAFQGDATDQEATLKRLQVLKRALQDVSAAVRRTAAINAFVVLEGQPAETTSILMALPFEDHHVVDDLFGQFHNRDQDIKVMPAETIETLCKKIEDVPALGYWTLHFLAALLPDHVARVADVLVKRALRPYDRSYDALPYGALDDLGQALQSTGTVGPTMDVVLAAVLSSGKAGWGLRYLVEPLYSLDPAAASASVVRTARDADAEGVRRIARSLEGVAPANLFDGVVVSTLLVGAYEFGQEVGERVGGSLHSALTTGMRSGPVGEPFPEDIALREAAEQQRAAALAGTELAAFWDEIVREVTGRIEEPDDD